MPNSASAAKRMRQAHKRRKRNRVTKKVIKTLSKRTFTSLAEKDFNQALVDLKAASSKIDKAALAACCIPTRQRAERASWRGLTPRRLRNQSRHEPGRDLVMPTFQAAFPTVCAALVEDFGSAGSEGGAGGSIRGDGRRAAGSRARRRPGGAAIEALAGAAA